MMPFHFCANELALLVIAVGYIGAARAWARSIFRGGR